MKWSSLKPWMRNTVSVAYTFRVIHVIPFAIIETGDKISDRGWSRLFNRIMCEYKDNIEYPPITDQYCSNKSKKSIEIKK